MCYHLDDLNFWFRPQPILKRSHRPLLRDSRLLHQLWSDRGVNDLKNHQTAGFSTKIQDVVSKNMYITSFNKLNKTWSTVSQNKSQLNKNMLTSFWIQLWDPKFGSRCFRHQSFIGVVHGVAVFALCFNLADWGMGITYDQEIRTFGWHKSS